MRLESKRRQLSVLVVGVALALWLDGGGPASAAAAVPSGDGAIQGTAATPLVLVFHGLLETSLQMVDLGQAFLDREPKIAYTKNVVEMILI